MIFMFCCHYFAVTMVDIHFLIEFQIIKSEHRFSLFLFVTMCVVLESRYHIYGHLIHAATCLLKLSVYKEQLVLIFSPAK